MNDRDGAEFLQWCLPRLRVAAPEEAFHLILCRNVAFTYFDDELQRRTLCRIEDRLLPGGALVIGSTEVLPAGATGLEPWWANLRAYRRPERSRSRSGVGSPRIGARSPRGIGNLREPRTQRA